MKKLVYTVQGLECAEQENLLYELLPEVLRAYGCDGKLEVDLHSAAVSFNVPRTIQCSELEQSVNIVLSAHGMQLLLPPGVRYYAYVGPKNSRKNSVSVNAFVASMIAAISLTLVVTMLLTAVISGAYWNGRNNGGLLGGGGSATPSEGLDAIADDKTLSLVDQLIQDYAYDGVDQEALMEAVIKAYVAATGDIYAEYCLAARAAANELSLRIVPVDTMFRDEWRKHPGHTGLLLTKDGVHPTEEGYKLIAETFLKAWNQ